MTPQEFKERYPQYIKLEGNELWDTMEDVLSRLPQYQLPEEVKDWKGNLLKPGHEFCYIRVIDRQLIRFAGVMWIDGDKIEMDRRFEQPRREDEPCWKVGPYYKVDWDGYFQVEVSFGILSSHISIINFDLKGDDTRILAIKGLSDNKEEYEQYKNKL